MAAVERETRKDGMRLAGKLERLKHFHPEYAGDKRTFRRYFAQCATSAFQTCGAY